MKLIVNCPQRYGDSFSSCLLEELDVPNPTNNVIDAAISGIKEYSKTEECLKHLDDWGYITFHIPGTGFISGSVGTLYNKGWRGDDITLEYDKAFKAVMFMNAFFRNNPDGELEISL